ncbi:MAG: hypothetical protein KIS94_03175 [Chitinophagales bacterium]|nr:hypothetical protein [Chitinophagales bacterium]
MKAIFTLLILPFWYGVAIAQQEVTFQVKKKYTEDSSIPMLPNFDFMVGVDSMPERSTIAADVRPIRGLFDSIATFNIKASIHGNYLFVSSPSFPCRGILKLFKKKEDGTHELVFFRYIRVAGKRRE